ncbi:MAG: VWA domain-containing protein [Acidimicrobiia bacterium]
MTVPSAEGVAGSPITSLLTGFVEELRACGVPVSMVETIDAMRALEVIDISDRAGLKATLAATMVKAERHLPAFDTAFEVYFARQPSPGEPEEQLLDSSDGDRSGGDRGASGTSAEDLRRALLEALKNMDMGALGSAAGKAVDELSGFEPGRPVGGTYYLYRTLRRLDIDQIAEMLRQIMTEEAGDLTEIERRLLGEEVESRLEELREALRDEIRRRLVADRGREAVARTLRRPLTEDVDLMHATRQDLEAIEDAIVPLTRKLAARLARRRRRLRRGRLDFRKTVRRSLATGGVPMEPVFRAPHPHRPEVFLLCDISGSMATFARFTLQFTYAMSTQFSKLRSFAFIDRVDEVTEFFGPGTDFPDALARIASEAHVVLHDGHSDYGTALTGFVDLFGSEVTPRSTVIITGDARNNYRQPHHEMLAEIAHRARAVYWLNPEPRSYWDTGDSVMGVYSRWCDGVHEVRTLRQLESFVEQISLPVIRPHARAPR